MQSVHVDPARENFLRFVFNAGVVSYHVPADVSFGEIAQALGKLPSERYGHPIAINVTLSRTRSG
jgi:hypothetical protein